MKCPKCGVSVHDGNQVRVIDSRPTRTTNAIRRRRLCVCGLRFTTTERIVSTRRGRIGAESGELDLADLRIMRSQLQSLASQIAVMVEVVDAAVTHPVA